MKSFDLIRWENVHEDGIVTEEKTLCHAFAPEITYSNGYFYIAASPSGNGHYLYRSSDIEGPYQRITENFGEMIDGSFFLDSDEKKYFLRASETGITVKRFRESGASGDFPLFDSYFTIRDALIGNWTEGPYLLKRYGYYYLTYTGTHFLSDAYRVDYASGKDLSETGLKFHDTLLLSTDKDFYGLGHSMTFLGPDLDSYYIAYHNMSDSGKRYLNISRLLFDGQGHMTVNGAYIRKNPKWRRPYFETFCDVGDYLSQSSFDHRRFSAEYNFIGKEAELILGWKNEAEYQFIALQQDRLVVCEVKGKEHRALLEKKLSGRYDEVFHTVRIQYGNGRLTVYLDQMEIVLKARIRLWSGKIGYRNNRLPHAYLAYSTEAYGSSDLSEIKKEAFFLKNCQKVKDEYLTCVRIDSSGTYAIHPDLASPTLLRGIRVDGMDCPIGKNGKEAEVFLEEGVHDLSVSVSGKERGSIFLTRIESAADLTQSDFIENSRVFGKFTRLSTGIYFENDRNAILTRSDYRTYEFESRIRLIGNSVKDGNFVGLIADARNYSKSNAYETMVSFQGYMLAVNLKKVIVADVNYSHTRILKTVMLSKPYREVTLKIIKETDGISFYINTEEIYRVKRRKYIGGMCGIFNYHSSAVFRSYRLTQK